MSADVRLMAHLLLKSCERHCSSVVVRSHLWSFFLCLSGEKVFSGN
ncbi:hypothetical protein EC915_101111 [Pseudomonas sp. LP_7_YM]|nr:hypothetical protein EC915_101111 [Pseudomonas sp. LP_7_YM]